MKIKITITTEYKVGETKEGFTPEQILTIDLINIQDNPSKVIGKIIQ